MNHELQPQIVRGRRDAPEPPAVEGARWIYLTRNKFALVDADRFDELNACLWRWQTGRSYDNGYAVRSTSEGVKNRLVIIMLHQAVMGTGISDGEIDHKNGDTLDCRKSNLRVCTHRQNMSNRRKPPSFAGKPCTSTYKGVSRSGSRWRAQIRSSQKHYSLGYFDTELEAAIAYDKAATQHFGEFARTNFPMETS